MSDTGKYTLRIYTRENSLIKFSSAIDMFANNISKAMSDFNDMIEKFNGSLFELYDEQDERVIIYEYKKTEDRNN